jgi:hypothetical protein
MNIAELRLYDAVAHTPPCPICKKPMTWDDVSTGNLVTTLSKEVMHKGDCEREADSRQAALRIERSRCPECDNPSTGPCRCLLLDFRCHDCDSTWHYCPCMGGRKTQTFTPPEGGHPQCAHCANA